eukprot:gene35516-43058_t
MFSASSGPGKPIKPENQRSKSPFKSSAPSSSASKKHKAGPMAKASDVLSGGVRVNKCVVSLSRRGADEAVGQGRVTVNGIPATPTQAIKPGDVVKLDGKVQHWEQVNIAKKSLN